MRASTSDSTDVLRRDNVESAREHRQVVHDVTQHEGSLGVANAGLHVDCLVRACQPARVRTNERQTMQPQHTRYRSIIAGSCSPCRQSAARSSQLGRSRSRQTWGSQQAAPRPQAQRNASTTTTAVHVPSNIHHAAIRESVQNWHLRLLAHLRNMRPAYGGVQSKRSQASHNNAS
jgi:hypothetical protein